MSSFTDLSNSITERITSLESRRQDNIAQNDRLSQLLNHVQKNLEHYQTATQELRQEQSLLLEKQHNEYEQKRIQLQKKMEIFISEKSDAQAKYAAAVAENEKLQAEHATMSKENKDILDQYRSLNSIYEKLKQDYVQLTEKDQQQFKSLEAKQHTLIELNIKLKTNDGKISSLETALAKAEDKIQALRHDYQFAAQEKSNLAGQVTQLQNILSKSEA